MGNQKKQKTERERQHERVSKDKTFEKKTSVVALTGAMYGCWDKREKTKVVYMVEFR